MKELGLPPSDLSTDQEFLRRVYFDTVGTLPTMDQARAFLADADPQKRTMAHPRTIVNRTWFWLLGRGIIHEPDDLRSTNPPENAALLAYLESELVSHSCDLKHIYRLILNSRTYQLSSKANPFNRNDMAHFSHYQVKRLGAETLLDAIGQVTERWDTYFSSIPEPYIWPTRPRPIPPPEGSPSRPPTSRRTGTKRPSP